mgnify:CR=1 FL=1
MKMKLADHIFFARDLEKCLEAKGDEQKKTYDHAKYASEEIKEIRNKYKLNESITNEKLQKVQQEFTDWYNNSVGERLQGNESLKRLYKEYGLAANSQFEEMAIDYKRYKDPFLRKIDDTIKSGKNMLVQVIQDHILTKGPANIV